MPRFRLVLDPIGRHQILYQRVPLFGTLIALAHQTDRRSLGIHRQPISRERWLGAAGPGDNA